MQALSKECRLAVKLDEELAASVSGAAKKHVGCMHWKRPRPVPALGPLNTAPVQVLHELGVATTLLTASPLPQVARPWAQLRYCASLTMPAPTTATVARAAMMRRTRRTGVGRDDRRPVVCPSCSCSTAWRSGAGLPSDARPHLSYDSSRK